MIVEDACYQCLMMWCNLEIVHLSNSLYFMKITSPTASEPIGFLTPAELRARWKVSAMFLWRLRRDGKLRFYRIGARGIRYSLAEIEQIEKQSAT